MICRPLSQFRRQMVQIGDGTLQAVHEESDIAEFDSLMREVEQMKGQIENLISNMVEKEKAYRRWSLRNFSIKLILISFSIH